ncbi:MAG: HU family DNA-binding protein [Myxococcota bacterium]
MTKAELIEKLQKSSAKQLSKKAIADIVDEVFENIAKSVKKEKRFAYPGFGTFTLRKRKARIGRNPKTLEEIKIPPSKTVTFRPAPNLKTSL